MVFDISPCVAVVEHIPYPPMVDGHLSLSPMSDDAFASHEFHARTSVSKIPAVTHETTRTEDGVYVQHEPYYLLLVT